MEIVSMSAAALGREMEAGRVDAVDLCEAFLARIEAVDPDLRIYARTTADRARREALESSQRAKSGMRRSPLDGVPVSWKDLYDSAGVATESGSRLLAGRIPQKDAGVLANMTSAGTVCLGKTHQTELAFSGLGINPVTSTPPNKAMPGHCPGGSSSGAAASLTHDLAAIAIGSDTGGSVRIPACWNNLVGLKTSYGALSNDGVVPLCPGFDTVGPLARTVEDAHLAYDALLGRRSTQFEPEKSLAGLPFVVPTTLAFEDCDPVVMAAFEAALRKMEAGGANIKRMPVPELAEIVQLAPALFPYEAWQAWGVDIDARGDVMYPPIRARFEQGRNFTRETYETASAEMLVLRKQFETRVGTETFLLLPTIAILPPKVADLLADSAMFAAKNLLTLRNPRFFSMLGSCALSLPLPETACGLQIVACAGREDPLLALGGTVAQTIMH